MCGRYRFTNKIEDLIAHFPDLKSGTFPAPRWNVAPTQPAPVMIIESDGTPRLKNMRWGLVPSWSGDTRDAARCVNARSESAAGKPSFRSAFKHRRCLVPAHGYYEWTTTPEGKQPWHFSRTNDALMCFAGLWESWTPPDAAGGGAEPVLTFTILTTAPNTFASKWHDRMPAILAPSLWNEWVAAGTEPARLQAMLTPYAGDDLRAWPVTPRMNKVAFESPACAEPVELQADLC
jgi:putative SOS response-associated peptidase YedK